MKDLFDDVGYTKALVELNKQGPFELIITMGDNDVEATVSIYAIYLNTAGNECTGTEVGLIDLNGVHVHFLTPDARKMAEHFVRADPEFTRFINSLLQDILTEEEKHEEQEENS